MNSTDKIKQDSINEFGTKATQNKFRETAEKGLWESEKILVEKYFTPNIYILDIGCGSGRSTIPLHQAGYNIIGVDVTPKMIETAQSIAEIKNLKIDYRVGDATKLEFDNETFEGAIFANNGWAQIPGKDNRQKALNELYRVLKKDGIFIFTSHQKYIAVRTFLFWIRKWIEYKILIHFGIKPEGVEYGDIFFKLDHDRIKKQFIHMSDKGEVAKQVEKAGFTLILEKSMGDISKEDATIMRGSLYKTFNSFKSPIFYVCKK